MSELWPLCLLAHAAVPAYQWERVLPHVPPLPYCETVAKLPV
mgnify:CR=1 FL=1